MLAYFLIGNEFGIMTVYQGIKAFIAAGNVGEVYGLWFRDKMRVKQHAELR